ncbi:MAG: hypothetical protein ACRBFS_26600 [Aureispira sp.]
MENYISIESLCNELGITLKTGGNAYYPKGEERPHWHITSDATGRIYKEMFLTFGDGTPKMSEAVVTEQGKILDRRQRGILDEYFCKKENDGKLKKAIEDKKIINEKLELLRN